MRIDVRFSQTIARGKSYQDGQRKQWKHYNTLLALKVSAS